MKILHIAESAQGGVGTYLAELLPHQIRAFGEDHVAMLLPHAHAHHVSGADRRSVRTWRRGGRSLISLIRLALAIRGEVARFQPTIVHAHSSFAGALVRLLYGWRSPPFRIVYCPHGWSFDRASAQWTLRITATLEQTLARWCDRIVVISEHERAAGLKIGIPDDKLTRILNGIADIAPVRPARWDDDRLKVLFVGRLDEQKGFDTLLDAVEPFKDRICVRAAGKAIAGPESAYRRSEQVTYLGWRSLAEVATEIAAADVIAIPSRWEGFGLVALEAMRAERAVVASNVGGLREIVVDGVTGFLTPADQPELLGRTLLSATPARWRAMGQAGRRRYEQHFTAERMHRELAALYAQLMPETQSIEPIGQALHA